MTEILAAPLFLFAFLPISLLLVRGAGGIFFAPVISSVVAIYSAILHVLVDAPILWFWIASALIANALVFVMPSTRTKLVRNIVELKSPHEYWLIVVALVVGLASLGTTPPPLGWDARSMWFAIPSWLNGPSEQYLTAQLGGAQTGWAEYPFFGPASFATLWQLMGVDEDLWAASRLSGLLGVFLGATAISLVISRFGTNKTLWIKPIASLGFLTSLFFVADGYINNGYQDVMQGAAIALVLASVLAYNSETRGSSIAVIGIASLAALNIKQEGFWFTFGILLLGTVYWAIKREFWFSLAILPSLAGKVTWDVFGGIVQMPASGSTEGMFGRLPEFFQASSVANQVLAKILGEWFPQLHLGLVALLIVAATALALSKQVLEATLLLLSGLGLYVVPIVTYALGNARDSIDWWLGTSYTRITASFTITVFLTLVIVALANAPESRPKPKAPAKSQKAPKKAKSRR